MRVSKLLGTVRPTYVELEDRRHRKLKEYARRNKTTINAVLRKKLLKWIDGLPLGEDTFVGG